MKFFNFFSKEKIIIRGIQRSGTNFLENILSKLDIDVINKGNLPRNSPGHKHFRVQNDKLSIFMDKQYLNDIYSENLKDLNFKSYKKKNIKNILILKDPVNWILSINRWAKKCNWIPINNDLRNDFELMTKYLKEWDYFHLKWFELSKDKELILILQWEDLLTNFDNNLKKIIDFVNIKNSNLNLKINDFKNIKLSEDSEILEKEKIDMELSNKIYSLVEFKNFRKIYK